MSSNYDCIAPDSLTARAPGADDNASGVAALLEMARIVRDLPLERTVTFALWNAEEIGFLGSQHFVDEMSAQGLDVGLYVNLDCLGYTDGSWRADVQAQDSGLRRAVENLLREYTGISPTAAALRSDWVPFWLAGVPTLYVCEDPVNPRVNGPTDSLHYLDSAYARDMTRADLAAMLGAAKLQGYDWPIAPWTVLLPTCATEAPGLPPGAFVAVRWEGQDFDGSVAGYEYRVIAPTAADTSYHFVPASIESISFAAVAEGLYTVSVRAVDDDGLRDPDPAGAVIPVNTSYGYPLLDVKSGAGGRARFRAGFCVEREFPDTLFAGERVSITWRADASRYCSRIVGYQWAWDDTLSWHPSVPAPGETLLVVDLEEGRHVLGVRATDDLGYTTRATLDLTALPVQHGAGVLLVDDCDVLPGANDALEDAFFDTVFAGSTWSRWDPHEHVSGGDPQPPFAATLARAGCVVWSVDNSSPELASFETGGYSLLEGYVRAGGNLILAGFCPAQAAARAQSYPIEFQPGSFLRDYGGLIDARNTGARTSPDPPSRYGFAFLGGTAADGTGLDDAPIDSLGKWSAFYRLYGGIPSCDAVSPADGSEVLYLFDAHINTSYEGAPCGVRRFGTAGEGSVVVLGFPLYYVKTPAAQGMVQGILRSFTKWQEPAALLSLSWTADPDSVTLRWTIDAAAGAQAFHVLRRDAGEQAFATLATLTVGQPDSGTHSYVDAGVVPGRSYEYGLSVVERWGGSTFHGPWLVATPEAPPGAFALLGTTPNPSGHEIAVNLAVPQPGVRVEVVVYDVAGRVITTLCDRLLQPGTCVLTWDGTDGKGSDVASGVYFILAKAGRVKERTKVLLVR